MRSSENALSQTKDTALADTRSLSVKQQRVTDNLSQLLDVLPPAIRQHLERANNLDDLLEIVLDLGRVPEARYPEHVVELGQQGVTDQDPWRCHWM